KVRAFPGEISAGKAYAGIKPLPLQIPKLRTERPPDGHIKNIFTAQPESRPSPIYPNHPVMLHHPPRDPTPHLDVVEMRPPGSLDYEATVPADQIDKTFDWQCFVEELGPVTSLRWPEWEFKTPYVIRRSGDQD